MATYILLNENKEHAILGTDCLFWIDDRLSPINKKAVAINKVKRLETFKPYLKGKIKYFAKYKLRSTNYNAIEL